MEREPIPIVTLPGAIFGLMLIGAIWTFTDSHFLINFEKLGGNFYISIGAITIIIGPILSQIIISMWRKFFGFCSIDYSQEFLNSVPFSKRWIIQTVFDQFWHGGSKIQGKYESNIPNGILEYSRRRSSVAMSYYVAVLTTILLLVVYLVFLMFASKFGLPQPNLIKFVTFMGFSELISKLPPSSNRLANTPSQQRPETSFWFFPSGSVIV